MYSGQEAHITKLMLWTFELKALSLVVSDKHGINLLEKLFLVLFVRFCFK